MLRSDLSSTQAIIRIRETMKHPDIKKEKEATNGAERTRGT